MALMAVMGSQGWRVSLAHVGGWVVQETVAAQEGGDSLGAGGLRASQEWMGEMGWMGGMAMMDFQGRWYVAKWTCRNNDIGTGIEYNRFLSHSQARSLVNVATMNSSFTLIES